MAAAAAPPARLSAASTPIEYTLPPSIRESWLANVSAILYEASHGNLVICGDDGSGDGHHTRGTMFLQRLAGPLASSLPAASVAGVGDLGVRRGQNEGLLFAATRDTFVLGVGSQHGPQHFRVTDLARDDAHPDILQGLQAGIYAAVRDPMSAVALIGGGEFLVIRSAFITSLDEEDDEEIVSDALRVWVVHRDLPADRALQYDYWEINADYGWPGTPEGSILGCFTREMAEGPAYELLYMEPPMLRRAIPRVYGLRMPSFATRAEFEKRGPLRSDHGPTRLVSRLPRGVWQHVTQCGEGSDLLAAVWAQFDASDNSRDEDGHTLLRTVHLFRLAVIGERQAEPFASFDLLPYVPAGLVLWNIDAICWAAPLGAIYVAFSCVSHEFVAAHTPQVPRRFVIPLHVTRVPMRLARQHGFVAPPGFALLVKALASVRLRGRAMEESNAAVTAASGGANNTASSVLPLMWASLPEEVFELVLEALERVSDYGIVAGIGGQGDEGGGRREAAAARPGAYVRGAGRPPATEDDYTEED